jgi:hypothetical protein
MIGFATVPGAPTVLTETPPTLPLPPAPPAAPELVALDELAVAFDFDDSANSLKCGVDNTTSQLFVSTEDGVVMLMPVCTHVLVDLFSVYAVMIGHPFASDSTVLDFATLNVNVGVVA